MNKNDIIELIITDMGVSGEGIGRSEGCTFFVKNALIGDKVRAVITKMKKGYGYAKMTEVLSPSKDRIDPPCLKAARCGGCQIMQLSYPAQLAYKEQKVRNNLERLGGLDLSTFAFYPIIGMETESEGSVPLHYRNKMQYPFGMDPNGHIVSGFYAGRTHYLIATDDCPVSLEGDAKIRQVICTFAEENGLSVYDEETGEGLLRHILIRKGYATGETMVCLVINGDGLGDLLLEKAFAEMLLAADPSICSISLNINKEKTNVILGRELRILAGREFIEDEIVCENEDGMETRLRFRISPLSFFQVNTRQTGKLYGKALAFAELTGSETVWDLYCGAGTISLFLAGRAKKVVGVEIIPQAIENAKENMELNKITNADFLCGKSEEIFPDAAKDTDFRADVVILDPPRKGCDKKLLDAIRQVGPERIVYVSCDSATLARDLKILTGGEDQNEEDLGGENGADANAENDGGHGAVYRVEKVQPVDMFSNTVHVEVVALLSRGKREARL